MRAQRLLILPLASVLLAATASGHAWGGSPADDVRRQADRIVNVLADPALKETGREQERQAAIRRIAEESFDFGEMTRRTLGQHWRERTDAERAEFTRLFSDLLEHTYFTRISAFNGEKISVLGESIEGNLAIVRTQIVSAQGTQTSVDYRMLRRGDRWLIYDVVIEGVSLVANYRAQFDKIIRTSSYQVLVDKLRSKRG